MNRFKNIGVVYDLEKPSQDVLHHATEIALNNDATIQLLCVIPHDIASNRRELIEKSLHQSIGVDFSLHFISENPVVEITRFTIKQKLDLILIGNDQEDGLFNQFFHGSLALSLIRKTPCPIWVVKRPLSQTYQRILIAVDPLPDEEERVDLSLNRKLLEIGTSYAKRQSAECYVVTAWRLEGEGLMMGPFMDIQPNEIEKLKNEAHAEYAKAFENLQKANKELMQGCQTVMIEGEPGKAIPKFVAEKNIDLVVMGTLARTGIEGLFIGNTAESIINQIDCSILTIKPNGYVSPISP